MVEEFGPSLYLADGPTVPFLGFPYPTRMALVRLSDGGVWVWSPIALTPELESAVDSIGPLRHIVSPNKIHHLFLKDWAQRWPEARLHAPPGLARRRPDLRFDAELGEEADPAWAVDIDQTIFRGSIAMTEVAFFHRPSRTAILCDLVQRHDPALMKGLKGMVMRLDGLVGEHGSTPREWRASFLRRGAARRARAQVLAWDPERLVIAHGACAREKATEILARSLAWI
ncbi:MAG: DUF4336 domain-containing protein [Deltaproteobacteria bacterium]|nr:DUF4336 domain-containing protein [Deltaproteobacteria bacterium]MBW2695393.1 DUF4336 domain-containing protein [Deltaproteobacteria bacterium]